MTSLQKEMETRKVTAYRLVKLLDLSIGNHSQLTKQLNGQKSMPYERLKLICELISKETPDNPLHVEDIIVSVSAVTIK